MSAQPHNSLLACAITLLGDVYYDRVDLFALQKRSEKSMQNVCLLLHLMF